MSRYAARRGRAVGEEGTAAGGVSTAVSVSFAAGVEVSDTGEASAVAESVTPRFVLIPDLILAASAWAGSPSASASVAVGPARREAASGVNSWYVVERTKS